jgi:hypothetical protein
MKDFTLNATVLHSRLRWVPIKGKRKQTLIYKIYARFFHCYIPITVSIFERVVK